MIEQRFLTELEAALTQVRESDRREILSDMKEYFASGRADGKTDAEIAQGLGQPSEIAQMMMEAYKDEPQVKQQLVPDSGDFTRVVVKSDDAQIEISKSYDKEAHVDMNNHTSEHEMSVNVVNNTLEVTITLKKRFFFFQFGFKTPHVTIQLPERVYQQIAVENGNGSTSCRDVQVVELDMRSDNGRVEGQNLRTEKLTFYTDNGRIVLNEVESKKIRLETDNGRIEVETVKAELLRAKTDNGRIVLKEIEGVIKAETDNGRIEAYIPTIYQDIELLTDNGSIELSMDHMPVNGTFRTEKDYGKAMLFGEKARERVFGTGGPSVYLKTDNGSIEVKNRF